MRARPSRLLLVLAAAGITAGITAGLAGCSSGAAPVSAQEIGNATAEQLAAARQATLVPVGERIDQLTRERQAAVRTGSTAQAAAAEQQVAAYESLARSIRSAGSATAVRTLVDGSGLDLGRGDAGSQAG